MPANSVPPEPGKLGDTDEQITAKQNAWAEYHAAEQANVRALTDALSIHHTFQDDLASVLQEQAATDNAWDQRIQRETGGDAHHPRYRELLTRSGIDHHNIDCRAHAWLQQSYVRIVDDACQQLHLRPSWLDDTIWYLLRSIVGWDHAAKMLIAGVASDHWQREQPSLPTDILRTEAELLALLKPTWNGEGNRFSPGLLFPMPWDGLPRDEYKKRVCITIDALWAEVGGGPNRCELAPGQRARSKIRGEGIPIAGHKGYMRRVTLLNLWFAHPTKWEERRDLWQGRTTITWPDFVKKADEIDPGITNRITPESLIDATISALRWGAPARGVARTLAEFSLSDQLPDGIDAAIP